VNWALADRSRPAAAIGQLPLAQGAAHAQGAHDLAVGGGGFLRGVGLGLGDEGLASPRPRGPLVEHRQHHQHDAADDGHRAQRRVDHEGDQHVDRRPRDVEGGHGHRPRQGLAHDVELAHALGRGPRGHGAHQLLQDAAGQQPVQAQAGQGQQPRAHRLQRRLGAQGEGHHQGQVQQGQPALGRHDPVIDLHHVDGRGQQQDVDQGAEHGRGHQVRPAGAQGGDQRRRQRGVQELSRVSPVGRGDPSPPARTIAARRSHTPFGRT
jgi:hypothetical protein